MKIINDLKVLGFIYLLAITYLMLLGWIYLLSEFKGDYITSDTIRLYSYLCIGCFIITEAIYIFYFERRGYLIRAFSVKTVWITVLIFSLLFPIYLAGLVGYEMKVFKTFFHPLFHGIIIFSNYGLLTKVLLKLANEGVGNFGRRV